MRFQQHLSLSPEDNHISIQHSRTIDLLARIMLQGFGYKNYNIKLNTRSTADKVFIIHTRAHKVRKGDGVLRSFR